MIIWTFSIVTVLGAVSMHFLLEPPQSGRTSTSNEISSSLPFSIRALASIPQDDTSESVDLNSSANIIENDEILDLSCEPAKEPIQVAQRIRQIRLRGEDCQVASSSGEESKTKIDNLTNGFNASVFSTQPGLFTTDYISLDEGKNQIKISQTKKSGEVHTRDLVVIRASKIQ